KHQDGEPKEAHLISGSGAPWKLEPRQERTCSGSHARLGLLESLRRSLTEQRLVLACEPTELEEAMKRGDRRHRCQTAVGCPEGVAGAIKLTDLEEWLRAGRVK